MMKQIEIYEPGGPEVLVLRDAEIPEPKPFEVLIKVASAGVNRPDIVQRQGNYKPPKGASEIPCCPYMKTFKLFAHEIFICIFHPS